MKTKRGISLIKGLLQESLLALFVVFQSLSALDASILFAQNESNDNDINYENWDIDYNQVADENLYFQENEEENKKDSENQKEGINALPPQDFLNALENDTPKQDIPEAQPLEEVSSDIKEGPKEGSVILPDQAIPMPQGNMFGGAPPLPNTRRLLAEGEAPYDYIVQKGDTLFDICDQLIDEADYWPKLWSLNPQIKNPHFIFPGMRIRFYPGNEEFPPFLKIVSEDDMIPIDKGQIDETILLQEVVKDYSEPQKIVPIEVIGSQDLELSAETLDKMILMGGRYQFQEPAMHVPGFIVEEEMDPLGTLLLSGEGEFLQGLESSVRIEMEDEDSLKLGETYTVLREMKEVEDPVSGDFVGYLYFFVSHIQIYEVHSDSEISFARVSEIYRGLQKGDVVVPYRSTQRVFSKNLNTLQDVEGHILAFGYSEALQGGAGDFVFLSKPTESSLTTGIGVPIYQVDGKQPWDFENDKIDSDLPGTQIGKVIIVDTTPTSALGYVVESQRELYLGDRLFRMASEDAQ